MREVTKRMRKEAVNIKRLISFSLLTFVAVSITFLVYKEVAQRSQEKRNIIIPGARSPDTSLSRKVPSIDKDSLVKKPNNGLKGESPITNKGTVTQEIITKFPTVDPTKKGEIPSSQPTQQVNKSKITAYYFHGTHRCPTCLKIERYSREAIEQYFARELQDGRLEFKPLNVDEPENRHYIQDYQLYTRSLVIALYKNGTQEEWKNLIEVWSFVEDKEIFCQYVKAEVEKLLQKAK